MLKKLILFLPILVIINLISVGDSFARGSGGGFPCTYSLIHTFNCPVCSLRVNFSSADTPSGIAQETIKLPTDQDCTDAGFAFLNDTIEKNGLSSCQYTGSSGGGGADCPVKTNPVSPTPW